MQPKKAPTTINKISWYYRVSSDEQLENGSIPRQKTAVEKASKILEADIVRTWSGSVSSKKWNNVERKDLEEMLAECKRNRRIKYAIFDEVDRFMRSMLEIGYFIVEFKKLGVEVKFASQPDLKTDTAADTSSVIRWFHSIKSMK
jgi:DNA invertase Pin-like site-specific DNA recombinase